MDVGWDGCSMGWVWYVIWDGYGVGWVWYGMSMIWDGYVWNGCDMERVWDGCSMGWM